MYWSLVENGYLPMKRSLLIPRFELQEKAQLTLNFSLIFFSFLIQDID